MNSEQLNSARMARWSQNGEARLTLEAASEWLGAIGFCSYLPAGFGGVAPAASFLEAVVGRPARVPSAGERTRAHELLARMVENSAAVPLKLGPLSPEPPDSIASPDVFRYIYALRGNRNFKADPPTVGNEKVTPLALHCWQSIQQHGPLDLPALQSILGRDTTEAAMARALQELWAALYVCPVPNAKGQPAQWEILSRRFPKEVAAGAAMGQAEALSAVVSLYLYAVVAATEDEILAFLSPLAPQSKLREVLRGLGSMRQLDMIDIGGRAHLCLQGGLLPEMVVQLSEDQLVPAIEASGAGEIESHDAPRGERVPQRRPLEEAGGALRSTPKKFVPRKFAAKEVASRQAPPNRFNPRESGRRYGGGRNADRGPQERGRRWEKSGDRRAMGASDRAGDHRPQFKTPKFRPAGPESWSGDGRSAEKSSTKPWQSQKTFSPGAAPRRDRDNEGRPPRWEKSGPAERTRHERGGKHARPYGERTDGTKPRSAGNKRASGDRAAGTRPRRWEKPGLAGQDDAPSERRFEGKSPGFQSRGAKPWASRGAATRVGPDKPYSKRKGDKSAGARKWGRPKNSDGSERPPRREAAEFRADKPSKSAVAGARPTAKPYWAKSPRGGKAGGKMRGKKK